MSGPEPLAPRGVVVSLSSCGSPSTSPAWLRRWTYTDASSTMLSERSE